MSSTPAEDLPPQDLSVPWPNSVPVVDGVTPFNEVPQSPDFFEDDDEDLDEIEVQP